MDGLVGLRLRHRLGAAARSCPTVAERRRRPRHDLSPRSGSTSSSSPTCRSAPASRRRPRSSAPSRVALDRPLAPRASTAAVLAAVGQLAENEAVGAPTGIMDQSASLLGRADSAVFLDCRSLDAEVVDLGFAAAGLELLVIDTGVEHAHATGGYVERRASCEQGAAALGVDVAARPRRRRPRPRAQELLDDETFRRVRHVVTENQRVLDTVRRCATRGPRRDRRPARRLARVDARRLRDLGARARPRRRDRPGERRPRRADDRRRFRRRRDRARAAATAAT